MLLCDNLMTPWWWPPEDYTCLYLHSNKEPECVNCCHGLHLIDAPCGKPFSLWKETLLKSLSRLWDDYMASHATLFRDRNIHAVTNYNPHGVSL